MKKYSLPAQCFLLALLVSACSAAETAETADESPDNGAQPLQAETKKPAPIDICYAGRPDYRATCESAGYPTAFAFDEACVTTPAKPGATVGYAIGGAPYLKSGGSSWPTNVNRCRATGNGIVVLICCPD